MNAFMTAFEDHRSSLGPQPRTLARLSSPRRLLVLMALLGTCTLQPRPACPAVTVTSPAADPFTTPAKDWAKEAINNEIGIIQYKTPLLRYREHLIDAKGNQVRDVIESKDGAVARLIYRDNHVVSPEEDAAERDRLQAMLDSPNAFAKHMKGDQQGKKLATDLMQQFPNAMIYSFAPGQPQRPRPNARPDEPAEIVIDFKPNPKWSPPSLPAQALTGLRGRFWIDARSHRLMRMEGDIFQQVNFGWGFFAHVYPGGKLMLEQVEAADQRWIFSRFTESVVVRAVLVKTFRENSDVSAANFQIVPPMSYQEAIKVLLNTPLPKN
jgi:hypothetical protein